MRNSIKNHNNEPRAFCKKPFGPTWWNLSRIPIHWNLCGNMGETHSLWVSCWYGRSLKALLFSQEKNGDLWVLVFFDGLCLVLYNSWLEKTNCLSMHSGAQQRWSLAGNAWDGHSHSLPYPGTSATNQMSLKNPEANKKCLYQMVSLSFFFHPYPH